MKKLIKITLVILLLSLLTLSTVLAKAGVGNPTGEITDIDEPGGMLTLENEDGVFAIILPVDFDYETVEKGMTVTVKGFWVDDETIEAEWVKNSVDDEDETGEIASEDPGAGEGNAWGQGGVYCAEGKEDAHPLAARIAEKYGVSEGYVMEYVCGGMGFGDVMLALKMGGDDPGGMLLQRMEGRGWGQIWKDADLIGKDKADSPPPGLLKKGEKPGNGPPEGKGPNN